PRGLDIAFALAQFKWSRLTAFDAKPPAPARLGGVSRVGAAERAAIAARHVLDGLKGKACKARHTADRTPQVRRAQGVRRILDQDDLVAGRETAERRQIAGVSAPVNGDDRFRP